jgi:hypothetical protein
MDTYTYAFSKCYECKRKNPGKIYETIEYTEEHWMHYRTSDTSTILCPDCAVKYAILEALEVE